MTAAAAGSVGAIATTAVVGAIAGAAIGATVAGFTGGDILKGALMGAAAGAVGGAITGLTAGPGAAAGSVPLSESFAETAAGQASTAGAGAPILSGGGVQLPAMQTTTPTAGGAPTVPAEVPVPAKTGIFDRLLGEKGKYGLMEGLGKGVMKVGESLLKPGEEELSEIRIKEDEAKRAARVAANRPGYVAPPSWTLTPEWKALLTGYKLPPPKNTGLLTQGAA